MLDETALENSQLQNQLIDAKAQVQAFREKLNESEDDHLDKINDELDKLKQLNESQLLQITELQLAQIEQQKQFEDSQKQRRIAELELQETRDKIRQLVRDYNEMAIQMNKSQENVGLEDEIARLKDELDTSNSQVFALRAEIDSFKKTLHSTVKRHTLNQEDLQKKMELMQMQLSNQEKEEQITQLENRLLELTSNSSTVSIAEVRDIDVKKIESLQREKRLVELELIETRQKAHQLERDNQELLAQQSSRGNENFDDLYQEKLHRLENELNLAHSEVLTLTTEIDQFKKTLNTVNKRHTLNQEDMQKKMEYLQIQMDNQENINKIQYLEARLYDHENSKSDEHINGINNTEEFVRKQKIAEIELAQANSKIQQLEKDIQHNDVTNQQRTEEMELLIIKLKNELDHSLSKAASDSGFEQRLQRLLELQVNEARQRISLLENELSELQEQHEKDIIALKKTITDLEFHNVNLKDELDQANAKVYQMSADIDNYKKTLHSTNKRHTLNQEDLQKKMELMQMQLASEEHVQKIAELEGQVKVLRQQVKLPSPSQSIVNDPILSQLQANYEKESVQKQQIEKLKNTIDELEKEVQHQKKITQTQTNDYFREISQLHEQIQGLKLLYDEQVNVNQGISSAKNSLNEHQSESIIPKDDENLLQRKNEELQSLIEAQQTTIAELQDQIASLKRQGEDLSYQFSKDSHLKPGTSRTPSDHKEQELLLKVAHQQQTINDLQTTQDQLLEQLQLNQESNQDKLHLKDQTIFKLYEEIAEYDKQLTSQQLSGNQIEEIEKLQDALLQLNQEFEYHIQRQNEKDQLNTQLEMQLKIQNQTMLQFRNNLETKMEGYLNEIEQLAKELNHERNVTQQQLNLQIEQLNKENTKKNQHIQYLITQMNKQSQELHAYIKKQTEEPHHSGAHSQRNYFVKPEPEARVNKYSDLKKDIDQIKLNQHYLYEKFNQDLQNIQKTVTSISPQRRNVNQSPLTSDDSNITTSKPLVIGYAPTRTLKREDSSVLLDTLYQQSLEQSKRMLEKHSGLLEDLSLQTKPNSITRFQFPGELVMGSSAFRSISPIHLSPQSQFISNQKRPDVPNTPGYSGDRFGQMRHGNGKYINFKARQTDSQHIYQGTWRFDKRHGQGILTNLEGKLIYRGQWEFDCYNGQGLLYNLDPKPLDPNAQIDQDFTYWDSYEGEFKQNSRKNYIQLEFNGKGIMYLQQGDRFEGDFLNGKPNGQGRYIYCNGKLCSGVWKDGKLES